MLGSQESPFQRRSVSEDSAIQTETQKAVNFGEAMHINRSHGQ
jgi:hypothetical protein